MSYLQKLLLLAGAGSKACLAEIHPEQTLLVVFVKGLPMVLQVCFFIAMVTCITIILSTIISPFFHFLLWLQHCCLFLIGAVNENGTPRKQDSSAAGQKKLQTNVRILRGHSGAVTALHCVTRREVWDLVGDREDAGFFISGSTDCMVIEHNRLISFPV